MKFKVGDMVTVKTWEEMAAEGVEEDWGIRVAGNFFSRFMKPLCGKPAIVKEVDTSLGVYELRPMEAEDLSLDWDWKFSDAILKE